MAFSAHRTHELVEDNWQTMHVIDFKHHMPALLYELLISGRLSTFSKFALGER